MFYLSISKHSPAERARARSGGEWGWTSFDEVGEVFDGRELTLRDYVEVEDRYVCAVRAVMDLFGAREAVLRHVFVEELPPGELGELYNGRVVGRREVEILIRAMLRGADYHAALDLGNGVYVRVGFDFYLDVYAPSDLSAFVEVVGECGLYVDHFEGEDDPDDEEIPPPADHDFWSSVRRVVEASAEPVLLMERRARGRYGEDWYLVGGEDLDDVVSGLRAGAEVLVYPDLEVTTTTPDDLVESVASSVGSLSSIVLFRQPRPRPRLDYLRVSEGLGAVVPEAFVGAEGVGYFPDPDVEATDTRCLRATV